MEHKKYQIILADPPWNIRWQGRSSIGTKPLNYPTMTITELVEFGEKVKSISADCSKLFMWTTNAFLPEALGLLKHWGFQYDPVSPSRRLKNNKMEPGDMDCYACDIRILFCVVSIS